MTQMGHGDRMLLQVEGAARVPRLAALRLWFVHTRNIGVLF
jgi:hypothetical protein